MSHSLILITVLAAANIVIFLALVVLVIRARRRREASSFDFNQVEINQEATRFFEGLELPTIASSYGISAKQPAPDVPEIIPGAIIAGIDGARKVHDSHEVPVA